MKQRFRHHHPGLPLYRRNLNLRSPAMRTRTTGNAGFGILPTCVTATLLAGCATPSQPRNSGPETWHTWQQQRRESVAGTNGWTTIVGLYWLKEGRYTVGSGPEAAIQVTPEGPRGEFIRAGTNVWFHPAPGLTVTVDGRSINTAIQLASDAPGPATKLNYGQHQLWLLERGDRLGIRVRDRAAAARRDFHGLSYFPWQARWQIEARFEAHPAGQTLPIRDVTGATKLEPNPGVIIFLHDGREHRLEALADTETQDLFILFRDGTSGSTTYPPGRFLHAPYPDAQGRVILDFNRAYNPPCAFTDFATCPRPPAENQLPFPVSAGEKRY